MKEWGGSGGGPRGFFAIEQQHTKYLEISDKKHTQYREISKSNTE